MPGAKAIFEKFDGYVPREEKASWLSGGKRINFDRIEWQIVPDGATAGGALQNGEVDWLETPLSDLIPLLRKNRNIAVDIADPLGNIGSFRINHLYPPFNDVRARRAVQIALSQEDYMQARRRRRRPRCGKRCPATSRLTRRSIRKRAASI